MDAKLKKAADKGLYIGIKVYQGDVAPDWIYDHGVPRVQSSNTGPTPITSIPISNLCCPKSQPYGRFARGFNHAEGKDTLFFDIDDDFFSGDKLDRYEVTVRIVYYDAGEGNWALKYNAAGNKEKTAFTVTKTNTELWKEKMITIPDDLFSNGCKNNADLMLVNTDNNDDIFHMVEINLDH